MVNKKTNYKVHSALKGKREKIFARVKYLTAATYHTHEEDKG